MTITHSVSDVLSLPHLPAAQRKSQEKGHVGEETYCPATNSWFFSRPIAPVHQLYEEAQVTVVLHCNCVEIAPISHNIKTARLILCRSLRYHLTSPKM